jgi:hypothetical protein
MNRYMQDKWSWIEGGHAMRMELFSIVSDSDLAFSLGGQTMTLGVLFREIGEIEYAYLQSLITFKQDWLYRNIEAGLDTSSAQLMAWYQTLDDQLKSVVSAFTDEDLTKPVQRPTDDFMPVEMQLDVYLQALLIFFGKATIYLRAMNKPLPDMIRAFIG